MSAPMMTLDEIRATGLAALMQALGPDGMIRFLQQFETGSGDYSTERHQWLDGINMDQTIEQIRQRQKPAAP
jgi:hypothetical protein